MLLSTALETLVLCWGFLQDGPPPHTLISVLLLLQPHLPLEFADPYVQDLSFNVYTQLPNSKRITRKSQ